MRLLSWNLLRNDGARAEDVARLIERHRPDLALMQEATEAMDPLPRLVAGRYERRPMSRRRHGLAVWSATSFTVSELALPQGTRWDLPPAIRRSLAPRHALVVRQAGSETVVTVHLDHGQNANRRQLRHITRSVADASVIIGDFNALGATTLDGFDDVGPRVGTYCLYRTVPFRLDRCLARGLRPVRAEALERGRSDHRPILVELTATGLA